MTEQQQVQPTTTARVGSIWYQPNGSQIDETESGPEEFKNGFARGNF